MKQDAEYYEARAMETLAKAAEITPPHTYWTAAVADREAFLSAAQVYATLAVAAAREAAR